MGNEAVAETPTPETPATETPETKPAATPPAAETPTPETKPAEKATPSSLVTKPTGEQKPPTTGKQDDGQSTVQGAPEKYELKLPEGGFLDDQDVKDLEVIARENKWTNEQAQAALEGHADRVAALAARFLEETTSDPTYGGEKLEETQRLAVRALDAIRPAGTPRGDGLRRLLDKSGHGNNLEIVSFLADIGRGMADDRIPVTRQSDKAGDKTNPADVLYGGKK